MLVSEVCVGVTRQAEGGGGFPRSSMCRGPVAAKSRACPQNVENCGVAGVWTRSSYEAALAGGLEQAGLAEASCQLPTRVNLAVRF